MVPTPMQQQHDLPRLGTILYSDGEEGGKRGGGRGGPILYSNGGLGGGRRKGEEPWGVLYCTVMGGGRREGEGGGGGRNPGGISTGLLGFLPSSTGLCTSFLLAACFLTF